MTAQEYRLYLEREAAKVRLAGSLGDDDPCRYLPLNLQRMKRIEKTYTAPERVEAAVRSVKEPQLWMALTEPWCGDCAQNLSYVAKIAALNPAINLRFLLRDLNPKVMDEYLTEGRRSIPKLVAFDLSGKELFRWGPRPQPAVELFRQLQSREATAEETRRELHLWYARNRGRALEQELIDLLSRGREDHPSPDPSGLRGTCR